MLPCHFASPPFPSLARSFDNNSLGSHGDNCAVFTANNMEEEAIKAGTKTKCVGG